MRVCLISLIVFSYFLAIPLAKKNSLFSSSSKKIFYRVKKGDNLGKIARRFQVNTEDLESWNHLENPDHLEKGQSLIIYQRHTKSVLLSIGDTIILHKPVRHWKVLKGYRPSGDVANFGLLCKVSGKARVKPATSGVVVKISVLRGYGKYILIDHGKGWHSMYSNLEDIEVKLGQHVDLSDFIGKAKNNKLFFLLAYNGKPVNPVGYFKR